jgi:hypothetical protein
MWFTWIGTFILETIKFLFKKFSFSKAGYVVVLPMYMIYLTLIFASWTLFLAAAINIVNNLFDILNMVNTKTSNGTPIFKCFFYLLNALGVSEALKVGVALLVSDILAIVTLKGADAFKVTTKEIIVTTKGIFDK